MGTEEITSIINLVATIILVTYAALQTQHVGKQSKEMTKQSREMSLSRNADVLLQVYEIMDNLRPKWHELYKLPPYTKWDDWDNSQRGLADHVGTQLERVAVVAVAGLIDKEYIMESWAGVFRNCWKKLESYIKDYREKSGHLRELQEGLFQQRMHFEKFTIECKDYLERPQKSKFQEA